MRTWTWTSRGIALRHGYAQTDPFPYPDNASQRGPQCKPVLEVSFRTKISAPKARSDWLPATIQGHSNDTKQTFPNTDTLSLADAVRKLACHIPYSGTETEATQLSLHTLEDLLVNNYNKILHEREYSKDLSAGIYLSGPEPEIKNRIIYEYSTFTCFLLQVNITDEDGEPIQ